jgi:hypothetical protein
MATGYVNDIKDSAQENVSTTELQALVGYIEDALSFAADMCRSRAVGADALVGSAAGMVWFVGSLECLGAQIGLGDSPLVGLLGDHGAHEADHRGSVGKSAATSGRPRTPPRRLLSKAGGRLG